MNTLLALALISGLASSYGGPAHIGQPLYCDRGHGLTYDETAPPWVAIDAASYTSLYGRPSVVAPAQCTDHLAIRFANGQVLHARALDAGHLAQHNIIVDIPFHLAPFSVETGVVPVTVINYSLLGRALE